jgi:septal ring factor EnvC (AmiA/AmiB activator)
MLLNNALSGTAMEKPASRDDAEANIQAFKTVLREVKRLRQGCHLSCKEKKTLERELRPMEDEVKGVLKDLKREESRISRSNQRML